ncbi:GNAT family N-acetyltransferase [Hymenobacter amundsenii]|uniref:GNAT family N-acetyltransferase n=1 Tax=Hymenobacter amundsenii TaxID=2006685 RepID=UPI0013FD9778|nr:GNAT family N-acetyltransferase [Hymenobacter amundsenii]
MEKGFTSNSIPPQALSEETMTGKKFTPFPVLQTGRLTLRQLRDSDDHDILALRSNAQVNHYLDRRPSQSLNDARHFIHTVNDNVQRDASIYWALTLRGADNLIGTVCLFNFSENPAKAEIGYELLPAFQGKGFMHEALSPVLHFGFQRAGLRAIEAHTHSENRQSTRVLESLQFKRDGAADANITRFNLTHDG